jgi:hypothetical protein
VGRDAGDRCRMEAMRVQLTVQENARNSARSARKSAKMSMNLCSAVRSHIIGAERDYFVKGKSMDGLRKMS